MKLTLARGFFSLSVLARLGNAQDIFSKYIGDTTATAQFTGPSASELSAYLTICTNYLHGLDAIPMDNPQTMLDPIIQVQVDGVCQFCTSVAQSRVDSCCAVPTSVDCFDQFAPAETPEQTTPGSDTATETEAAPDATTTDSAGQRLDAVCLLQPMLFALGIVGWLL